MILRRRRKCHQPKGSRRPVHLAQHLVDVGDGDGDRDGLAVLLGHHEPGGVEDELHLLGVVVEVLLGVGREAPVRRPRRVVDVGEAVHVAPQRAPRHLADVHAVLGLDLLGELEDDRQDLLAVGDVELPHPQVHRLLEPGLLAARRVVGRVPGLLDHRLAVVALDEHAVLVVDAEVHRPDHQVAAALAQPALRRREQRRQDLGVVLELEEAEHPPAVVLVGVEGVVDLRADAPDHAPVAPGAEELRVAVLEEGVLAAAEEQPALQAQRGAPVRRGRVQPVRELDELAQLLAAPRRASRPRTRRRTLHARDLDRRLRQGPRQRARGAAARGARGRHRPLLPHRRGPARARRGDGGRPADHAGLQQLPRPHGRRARHAGRARRAGALRHRA